MEKGTVKSGYFKVAENGSCYISATFFNPITKDSYSVCVRDYDYDDCSRDDDVLYYMPINEDVRRDYLHHLGVILVGDVVKVIKGRKLPIGMVGTVTAKREITDKYGRWVADYVVLDNGKSTNVGNVERV